jgi:NAD(P)-dependent dehydrogenase (short-subunit alcohol dehydrogenase family)
MSDAMKSVVITGASTGIGRATALHMDRVGWRVFAGVRRKSDGGALRAQASPNLTPILMDVTDAKSIKAAAKIVAAAVGPSGLSGLVNNAGVGLGGPIEYLNPDDVAAAFDANVLGALRVTQALLPLLRAGRGRVVNVSSISGLIAMPFVWPYSGSKFALEAFSDALRLELWPWQIPVAVVEPGAIDTPIWSKAGALAASLLRQLPAEGRSLYGRALGPMQSRFAPHGIAPQEAAQVIGEALTARRPKTRYLVGRDARFVSLFRRLPDRLRDRIIARQVWPAGDEK